MITCTVTYNDGTSESKEIGLKGIKKSIKIDGEQSCEVADLHVSLNKKGTDINDKKITN